MMTAQHTLTLALALMTLLVLGVAGDKELPPVTAGRLSTTIYSATLTAQQVSPRQQAYDDIGFATALCELDRAAYRLHCQVSHTVPNAAGAFLGRGERNRAGVGAIYHFSTALRSFFEQTFQLEDLEGYARYSQVQDLLNGNFYLQILAEDVTQTIRGQIEQADNLYALMLSELAVPAVTTGTPHRGIALATYSYFNPLRDAAFDIVHDVGDATRVTVGHGVPYFPGEPVYEFAEGPAPPIIEEFTYTITEEHELFAGFQYLQVDSASHPSGAIRGQLREIDPIPYVGLTGRMDPNQVGLSPSASRARGCILVTYNCQTQLLEWLVVHSVQQPTSAQAHAAPIGKTGTLLFSLGESAESPIYGSKYLTDTEEYVLYAQQMYFEISSPNFPIGEIRGQLTTEFDFFAYLTGIQMVPPVTTANVGCATFRLEEGNYIMDFEIIHSIDSPIGLKWSRAPIGATAAVDKTRSLLPIVNVPSSPVIGELTMDDDESVDFVTGNSYLQVESILWPAGELRGQVWRISPCQVNEFPEFTPYEQSSFQFSDLDTSYLLLPLTENAAQPLFNWAALLVALVICLLFY